MWLSGRQVGKLIGSVKLEVRTATGKKKQSMHPEQHMVGINEDGSDRAHLNHTASLISELSYASDSSDCAIHQANPGPLVFCFTCVPLLIHQLYKIDD